MEEKKENAGQAEVPWAYLHRSLRMEAHPPLLREKYRVFSSKISKGPTENSVCSQ